ncbi:MAG TPA: transketolase, partial [Candidatus Magasanikbacteria bacterium]|nr:transketolase [Candidatus Magasanikbacteria bacterium]
GLALSAKYVDKLSFKTFVLLGDSEMAEGSVWEAVEIAAYYKLNNLIAVLDINRLGQRGETMLGHKVVEYQKRLKAFGWETIVIDGHNLSQVLKAYNKALKVKGRPVAIVAKTLKGKGVKMVENKEGWHGKSLSPEMAEKAIKDLGILDLAWCGEIAKPKKAVLKIEKTKSTSLIDYKIGENKSVREAYGETLAILAQKYPSLVVLDAEVSNSTGAEKFKQLYPKRFFEMFIAEQNMISTALGMSRAGKIPFVSTFAAFFSRGFDQIRMAAYSLGNVKFCGSHAGVSIGPDGVSQMGLEDIALFRSVFGSVVLYPCDAVATQKLVEEMARFSGLVYLRSTREALPVIYQAEEEFKIGGSKILKSSEQDVITIVAAGITVFEALKAYEELKKRGVDVRVIDLYSIKPIDGAALRQAAQETGKIVVVEDHYAEGGIAEAVRSSLGQEAGKVVSLAVKKRPHSGTSEELLTYEEISAEAIIKKII